MSRNLQASTEPFPSTIRATEEPFVKKTLFEDVLVDAAPKQKMKPCKQGESSLKTVSISRDSILARAQGIITTSTDDCKYQNGSFFRRFNSEP